MKKILIFVVLIAVVIGSYYFLNTKKQNSDVVDEEPVPVEIVTKTIEEKLLTAEIVAPNTEQKIKFINGTANYQIDGFENYASISPKFFVIDNAGVKNYFTEININSGGSGSFKYLGHFLDNGETLQFTSSEFIGDRVPIISVLREEIEDKAKVLKPEGFFISVNYLDRKQDQSFADEPNVPSEKVFRVENKILPSKENIFVSDLVTGQSIKSPLSFNGYARGYWFFEASAPVLIVDWDGKIIGEGLAKVKGDWMTADFVPFDVDITYIKPTYGNTGSIILKKDNPSGLPEKDDALEFNIFFK